MGTRSQDVWILAAISGALAALVLLLGNAVWYGDSHTYVNYAAYMARGEFNPNLYWRTAGYPIFLILTGVVATGSVWGALIVQAIAAAAVPILTYLILAPVNRCAALATGALSAVSLICYQFTMTIYPDEIYMVGLVLLAFLLCRWFAQEGGTIHLYAIAGTCFALAWLRPVGLVFGVACLGFALWRRRALVHVAICAALFVGANVALHAWQRQFGEVRSMNGRQLFFNVYLNSGGMDVSGPRGTELRRFLVEFFRDDVHKYDLRHWATSEEDHQRLFVKYADSPEQQVDAIFREPTMQYFWAMFLAADVKSNVDGDRLFLWTAIEHASSHPREVLAYVLDGYRSLVVGHPWRFFRTGRLAQSAAFEPMISGHDQVPDNMVISISKGPFAKGVWLTAAILLDAAFSASYRVIAPVAYVLMVIGVLGFMRTPGAARTAALTVFSIHFCNVAALAALVDPQIRYQVQSVPLAIAGGGIGAYWIARRLSTLGDRLRLALRLRRARAHDAGSS